MSQQRSLDSYFRSLSGVQTMDVKSKKRKSLCLVKNETPKKSVVVTAVSSESVEVVDLCSDEESAVIKCEPVITISPTSNSVYSQPNTKTPQKTPETTRNFKSPSSSNKFYSPSKKRMISKKSPVKRNLSFGEPSQAVSDDSGFVNACEDMDDKSIFLLTIINELLKDNNLRNLLDTLTENLLEKCLDLVKPGIRVVCRLYWRQNCWFRRDQLMRICSKDKNDQIDDPTFQLMITCLVEKGLILQSNDKYDISFDQYTKLLNGEEIKQICKELKIKTQSKQAAVDALKNFSKRTSISSYFTGNKHNNATRLIEIMHSKAGTCYKLSNITRDSLDKLYVLMYLGINYETIREKRLELMLINDKIKRETYPIDKSMELDTAADVFKCKEEFLKYFDAHKIYDNYLSETDVCTKCKIVNQVFKLYNNISDEEMVRYKSFPLWLQRFTPPYIYIKILEQGVQDLKKDRTKDNHQIALDILSKLIDQNVFRQHKKTEWYAEKALILHKLCSRHNEAAEVLLKGLKSNLTEETKSLMCPRAMKIAKQQNIELDNSLRAALTEEASKHIVLEKQFHADHVNKQHLESHQQRGKRRFEVRTQDDRQYLNAEDYCIIHYTSGEAWTHGEHWEGRIITTIFFLLFWDIIYTKPRGVNGVFLSYYQMFPLDLYCESFYLNRKTLIDECLSKIEVMDTNKIIEIMKEKWDERPEFEMSGINRNISWEYIQSVCVCLGAGGVAAVCGRLARTYGYSHSGFPDLTLWNVHTGKIKFVEVKTDTDKPSIKQLQWMQYMREHDIDTGFCYVGVNTTRSKARGSHMYTK